MIDNKSIIISFWCGKRFLVVELIDWDIILIMKDHSVESRSTYISQSKGDIKNGLSLGYLTIATPNRPCNSGAF